MIGELAKLTRFEHAVMLAIAVFIAEAVVLGSLPLLEPLILISLLVPMLSEMGSFALNDYLDVETDRLNKRTERPLVRGTISPEFALYFSIISLVMSTAVAFFINTYAFAIALLFNAAAVLYNWKLKDIALVGNTYIALTMAIPFIFGNYVVSQELSIMVAVLAVLGFTAGLAREIIKSVQDMKGDVKARGSKTLPVIIGKGAAVGISVFLYLVFIGLTAVPFTMMEIPFAAMGMIIIADVLVAAVCVQAVRGDYEYARKKSLMAFAFGMLGILMAAL